MAYDSTKHTRIVPAIPLNFRKQQSIKKPDTPPSGAQSNGDSASQDVGQGEHFNKQSTPLAATAPLTPESIPSVPAHDQQDETLPLQGNSENLEAQDRQDVVVNGQTSNPTATDSSTVSDAVQTSRHVPLDAEILPNPHQELAISQDDHLIIATRPNGFRYPPTSALQLDEDHTQSQRSNGTHDHNGKDGQEKVSQRPHRRADSLVFGSIGQDLSSPAVTFASPRHQSQSSRNSLMANNVNAAPFVPAPAAPLDSDVQSPISYTPVDAPPMHLYNGTQPWYPEVLHFPTAHMNYSQPTSPSLSQHSSSHNGNHIPSPEQRLTNGQAQDKILTEKESSLTDPGPVEETPLSYEYERTIEAPLQDYVLSQFGQLSYADCLLEFYFPDNAFAPISYPAHRLLAARSPRLGSELVLGSPAAEFDPLGLRIVRIWIKSKHVTAEGITDSLRYLYGAPLPQQVELDSADSQHASLLPFARFVGLAAAGKLLGLPEIENHGLALAKQYLSWDSMEQLLSYLNEAGPVPESLRLRDASTTFLARNFPKDFIFDTKASQLVDAPRLPDHPGSRPSTSDPRLSQIQFGEVDEPNQQPDHQSLVSSILMSLPFESLKALFEHGDLCERVGPSNFGHLQQAVVGERERRRIKAQRAKRRSSAPNVPNELQDPRLTDNLRWIEHLDHSFDGSLILSRSSKGEN